MLGQNMLGQNILLKSIDEGSTWSVVRSFSTSKQPFLVTTPQGQVVVASVDTVFITSDDGATWQMRRPGPQYSAAKGLSIDKDGVLYLSLEYAHCYRSLDNGLSWARMINGLPLINGVLNISSPSSGVVYASLYYYVFRSLDRGRTWENLHMFPGELHSVVALNIDTVFAINTAGLLYRSVDGGKTWEVLNATDYFYPRIFFTSGSDLFIASNGSLYSRNIQTGDRWLLRSTPTGRVTQLAVSRPNKLYAGTMQLHNFSGGLWEYDGFEWQRDTNFPQSSLTELAVDSNGTIGAVINNMFVRSTDGGETWSTSLSLLSTIHQFAATKTRHYMLSNEGIAVSVDRGSSWDLMPIEMKFSSPLSIAVSGDMVYVGGFANYYRSLDNATSFDTPIFPFITGSGFVRTIDAVGPYVAMGVDRTGAYFSSDYGLTWENYSDGLAAFDTINQILMTPSRTVFAAANSGVYEFSPTTRTWTNVNNGQVGGIALSLALGADGKVYVGTEGAGVYRTTKTWHTADVNEHRHNPNTMSAYPNPASSSVVIHLPSTISDECRIVVYNVLGEALPLTIDRSGSYASIRVASLPNGRYVARLFDRTQVHSIPFIVQR